MLSRLGLYLNRKPSGKSTVYWGVVGSWVVVGAFLVLGIALVLLGPPVKAGLAIATALIVAVFSFVTDRRIGYYNALHEAYLKERERKLSELKGKIEGSKKERR